MEKLVPLVLIGIVLQALLFGLIAGALVHLAGWPFWPAAGLAASAVVVFWAGAVTMNG